MVFGRSVLEVVLDGSFVVVSKIKGYINGGVDDEVVGKDGIEFEYVFDIKGIIENIGGED